MNEVFRCPTCRAPWRGVTTCPRCGSDLTAIMRVAVKAWELREAARAALCAGDRPSAALDLARAACRLHATRRGQRLLALALVAAGRMAAGHEPMEQPPGPER
jgi:predicted amidophosphoribosyltransferase